MNFSPDTGHSAACDKSREGQLWVSSIFGTCQPAHWPSGRGRHWDCSVNSPQEHHCCFPEACPCPKQVRTAICLMHNRFPIILAKCQRDCWDYLGIALSVQRVFFSLGITIHFMGRCLASQGYGFQPLTSIPSPNVDSLTCKYKELLLNKLTAGNTMAASRKKWGVYTDHIKQGKQFKDKMYRVMRNNFCNIESMWVACCFGQCSANLGVHTDWPQRPSGWGLDN